MKDDMISIINEFCSHYGVSHSDLFQSYKYKGAKKKKSVNGVDVSTIRMCLGYYFPKNYPITILDISRLIGYKDHSTICTNNKKIYYYIKNQDEYFMSYYNNLESIGNKYCKYKFVRNTKNGLALYN